MEASSIDDSTVQKTNDTDEAESSEKEVAQLNSPSMMNSALYLAMAEIVVVFGVSLNDKALMSNLFGLGAEEFVMLDFAMGMIFATIMTALATIDWTVVVLSIASTFHVVLIIWMLSPNTTCLFCACVTLVLSTFWATLEPIRLAYISNQLTAASPSYVKKYFNYIAGAWFLGETLVQVATFFLQGSYMALSVSAMVFVTSASYTALIVVCEVKTQNVIEKYFTKVRLAAVEIYRTHEGKKYWAMFHIGISLTGYYFACLILKMAQREQFRSIEYRGGLPGVAQGVLIAIPAFLAVVILPIVGFGVPSLLKRWNKEISDLQYIGLGMIFGCAAMILAMHIQSHIDEELKPARRQEGLLFLFNLLPTSTSFISRAFGKSEGSFVEVSGTSCTVFLSRNVADVDTYAISVINNEAEMWIEAEITLYEGTAVSYVVTRGNFKMVRGINLKTSHFLGEEMTMFLGCALNSTCEGNNVSFVTNDIVIQEDSLPPADKFNTINLPAGTYTIKANLDGGPVVLTDNFTTQAKNIHTGFVYEKEPGVPAIALFTTSTPQKIPLGEFIVQQILVAFREVFFTLGLLRFLYFQTRPNHPARPFVYSAFFFIYKGVPWIVLGGLRTSIFNFLERFVIDVSLAYCACCTILFIHLANKYEHMGSTVGEDED